ncbi:histidine kinase [Nonomuraea sp. MCN248]|uniref:Histidine kinase n=1 Tax=Nonomuraea corallina TaxID=2989783 RepID=A0ABT4S6A5_9ACTN|nr:ATP-binding protein [Nonomuraea corallina]MDA0632742.1 histidine kinase [Nonomuraea corallina]
MSPRDRRRSSREALAGFLDAERPALLRAYLARLEDAHPPLTGDPELRRQALTHAGRTIADVARSLRLGRPSAGDDGRTGAGTAAGRLHPRVSLRAATCLADVTLDAASEYLATREDGGEALGLVMRSLTESVLTRVHETTLAYSSRLLHDLDTAYTDERRRIARDLHDRVGSGLGVAHHQLELAEASRTDPTGAMNRVVLAHEAIQDAMVGTRSIVTGLHTGDQVRHLEKELARLVETTASDDVIMRLRVDGDEAWASGKVLGETFLIVREAVRNAVTHGAPGMVLITVDITPGRLRATVDDDGRGFDLDRALRSPGLGLTSMRERAELMGGRVTLTPVADRGTRVDLVVPLSERRDG